MWLARPLRLAAPLALGAALALVGFAATVTRGAVAVSPSIVTGPALHALTLDIVNRDAPCEYYSSFDVRPVLVSESDTHIDLQRTFAFTDGCTWRSFETLDRIPGTKQFRYSYREAPYECTTDATPAPACQRVGFANE
jgi:hypothetical protein